MLLSVHLYCSEYDCDCEFRTAGEYRQCIYDDYWHWEFLDETLSVDISRAIGKGTLICVTDNSG